MTVNCGCCDDDGIIDEYAAFYENDGNDIHLVSSSGCETHVIQTPGGPVTVNCCCGGDGISDPHASFAPVDHNNLTGGNITVNCGCCDDDPLGHEFKASSSQGGRRSRANTDQNPDINAIFQHPALKNIAPEDIKEVVNIMGGLDIPLISGLGYGSGVTVNCGCCHSDHEEDEETSVGGNLSRK